ncbi:Amidase [Candidatus Rhodobacter oscarellae]|uniref:Amidase n=1 Tax=Candidatus Rhodobacter oscarellae TaxID=1675527 RepID=A0A0J9E560_9RHOB|nr:amidase [Candidatus Rhodobacter lobularis]KMW57882.1 Amidase [Candidatus Rhodobacter lobularis]
MELHELTARALSERIAAGDASCVEVMRATLDRIGAVNDAVNAIVSLRDADALMAEAAAADAAPRTGWLHGIPIAVKDLVATKGLRTTKGSPFFADHVPDEDDLLAARLRQAGAIIIGKTNTPEFGLGSNTFNPVHGRTSNPYDPERSCGGSSGGAAVALACRMLAVADGSDMMGSLRNPAAWNNVYGMRPSIGVVPNHPGGEMFLHPLSTLGPMARDPMDLALLLSSLAGPDRRTPDGAAFDAARVEPADLSGMRIGWLGSWGGAYAYEDGIEAMAEAGCAVLEDLGAVVEPLAPPFPSEALWQAWCVLRSWSQSAGLKPLWDDASKRDNFKAAAQWEIETGLALSAYEVHRASEIASDWYRRAAELFGTYDALVLPTTQVWPFPHAVEYPTEIAGRAMDTYHRWMEVTIPVGLIGLPAISLPVGFGAAGLPMGMQLFGPRGSDARLLSMAMSYHAATDWPGARAPVL